MIFFRIPTCDISVSLGLFSSMLVWGEVGFLPGVLVRVSVDMMKHHDQKQVGWKGFILDYMSTLLFIIKGSQDGNLKRAGTWRWEQTWGHGGGPLTALFLIACSSCFLIEFRTTSLNIVPSTVGRALPYWSLIKKMSYRLAYSPILWRHPFSWESLLSSIFSCVKLT